ncbi:unnamed protein product [Closterium sp. NIES-65]|nr:unnamed protein product [Closterium sp. NIES-65]
MKRGAAAAALDSVLGAVTACAEKKGKITEFFGDEASCAKEDADNALCLMISALKLPECIVDDPVFPYSVQCFARAGPGSVPRKRGYVGGAGLKKVRQKMEAALAPVAARRPTYSLGLWRKEGGKQVLKPAGTRFGTQYIAMARLCEVRSGLATMVLSDEWKVWAAGDKDRKTAAEKFRAAVMDEEWWGVAEFFSSLMAVPFRAMRATDSSAKGMMGKLYDIMLQLTEDINDKLDASGNFLTRTERADITKIVKDRWDNSLACPMHVVGRILNPANQEEGIFRNDVGIFRRGKDGAPRHASLVLQEALLAYINLEGSFGKLSAIAAREAVKKGEMSMVQWCPSRLLHANVAGRSGYIAHNWNVVRNWYNKDGASTVVPGNIPDAPIPRGYNMDEEEEDDLLGGEGDDAVLADEYGEGVVVEKPRKEIGSLPSPFPLSPFAPYPSPPLSPSPPSPHIPPSLFLPPPRAAADLGGFRAMHPAWRLEALQLAAVHHPPARGSHAPPRLRGATGSSATMWGAAAS